MKISKSEFRDAFRERFNLTEIRSLCFDLNRHGVVYEDLAGSTLTEKIEGLIAFCERHGLIDVLSAELRTRRPNLVWDVESESDPSKLSTSIKVEHEEPNVSGIKQPVTGHHPKTWSNQTINYHLTIQSDGTIEAIFQSNGNNQTKFGQLDEKTLETLKLLLPVVRAGTVDRDLLKGVGQALFNLLFKYGEPVRSHFEEVVWPTVKGLETGKYITFGLTFQPSNQAVLRQIAALPWEYLYIPMGNGSFVATDRRVAFLRRPPGRQPLNDPLPTQGVKVMLAVFQPTGQRKVSFQPIYKKLISLRDQNDAARSFNTPLLLTAERDGFGSLEKLIDEIETYRPDIFHLLGHGQFQQADGGVRFALEKNDRQLRWYDEVSLADLFQGYQPPLVFLQACEGGRQSETAPDINLSGPTRLLDQGVASVIGMQYPIKNKPAVAFAQAFYSALAEGEPVIRAVQLGRFHLGLELSGADRENHADRTFGAITQWHNPASAPLTRRLRLILQTEMGERFETEVEADIPIAQYIDAFLTNWKMATDRNHRSERYQLCATVDGKWQPLADEGSFALTGVTNGETLLLRAVPLTANQPIRLYIEDEQGDIYISAVNLNTSVKHLANAFAAELGDTPPSLPEPKILLRMAGETDPIWRPLQPDRSLFEEAIDDGATLKIIMMETT